MKRSEKMTNALLALLVAVLAAICIGSVVQEQQRVNQSQQTRDGRDK